LEILREKSKKKWKFFEDSVRFIWRAAGFIVASGGLFARWTRVKVNLNVLLA